MHKQYCALKTNVLKSINFFWSNPASYKGIRNTNKVRNSKNSSTNSNRPKAPIPVYVEYVY